MTNPNSASPSVTQPNSAPSFLWVKLVWLVVIFSFWFTVVGLSDALANFIYGMPTTHNLSSALLYGTTALLFFYWSSSNLKAFMPEWAPIVPVLMIASVLLFKYESYLYVVAIDAFWLYAFQGLVKGQVFPWSWPARMLFVPDHVIVARVLHDAEEAPKNP